MPECQPKLPYVVAQRLLSIKSDDREDKTEKFAYYKDNATNC